MVITETDPGPARVLALAGDLDGESAIRVRLRLEEFLSRAGTKPNLILDLGEVDYLSFAGLQTLLHLAREMSRLEGRLVLSGVGGYVGEVLESTRTGLLFSLRPDRAAALEEF